MEILHQPPDPSVYIPLAEHQSRTPASFHSGPPVLHHRTDHCKILVLSSDVSRVPALSNLESKKSSNGDVAGNANGSDHEDTIIEGVDVWVTSEKLFLFSPSTTTSISIPYPTISLHAIQTLPAPPVPSPDTTTPNPSQGLYMQLVVSPEDVSLDDEEELDTISLTIIPPPSPSPSQLPTSLPADDSSPTEGTQQLPPLSTLSEPQKIFEALSACSNLHPDPNIAGGDDEDEDYQRGNNMNIDQSLAFQAGLIQPGSDDGGLPPALASGGWITAENMHEFVDEEGNWIDADDDGEAGGGGEEDGDLGPGAGTVRARQNGDSCGDDDREEETKWQRTS